MSDQNDSILDLSDTYISPYLMRPLRTYEQALSDIAAAKNRCGIVKLFADVAPVSRNDTERKSNIAA